MNKLVSRALFLIGWLLSPLTFWNDAFINIPLSYMIANLLFRVFKGDFLALLLGAYWFTNLAGLAIMYAAGKEAVKGRVGVVKSLLSLVITTAIYSFILSLIVKLGFIKPLP
jgi:hypothetical protein